MSAGSASEIVTTGMDVAKRPTLFKQLDLAGFLIHQNETRRPPETLHARKNRFHNAVATPWVRLSQQALPNTILFMGSLSFVVCVESEKRGVTAGWYWFCLRQPLKKNNSDWNLMNLHFTHPAINHEFSIAIAILLVFSVSVCSAKNGTLINWKCNFHYVH